MRAPYWICILIAFVTIGGCRRPSDASATTSSPERKNAVSAQTGASTRAFSYEKQVGMASGGWSATNIGCLAIFNDSLAPGTTVTLADQPPPQETYDKPAVREATLVERVSEECDHHLSASHDFGAKESYYRIRIAGAEWQGSGYQVAIVDPKHPLSVQDGRVIGDIDEDGTPEFFRLCFSNEGVHYQVWTGTPLEGRGRWHWYVYAGYDLEYNCTEKEYFGPK